MKRVFRPDNYFPNVRRIVKQFNNNTIRFSNDEGFVCIKL
jgi:hypothetical protein